MQNTKTVEIKTAMKLPFVLFLQSSGNRFDGEMFCPTLDYLNTNTVFDIIVLTHSHSELLLKVSSATVILLKITWE